MRFLFLLIIVSTLSLSSSAQNRRPVRGYVVTLKGDTIHGLIKPANRMGLMKIYDAQGNKMDSYNERDLYAYQLNRDKYINIINQVDIGGFFKVLVEGHATLYVQDQVIYGTPSMPGTTTRSVYIVRKSDEAQYVQLFASNDLLKNKQFKKNSKKFFSDDPAIIEKIEKGLFNPKTVIPLVKEYNKNYQARK